MFLTDETKNDFVKAHAILKLLTRKHGTKSADLYLWIAALFNFF